MQTLAEEDFQASTAWGLRQKEQLSVNRSWMTKITTDATKKGRAPLKLSNFEVSFNVALRKTSLGLAESFFFLWMCERPGQGVCDDKVEEREGDDTTHVTRIADFQEANTARGPSNTAGAVGRGEEAPTARGPRNTAGAEENGEGKTTLTG